MENSPRIQSTLTIKVNIMNLALVAHSGYHPLQTGNGFWRSPEPVLRTIPICTTQNPDMTHTSAIMMQDMNKW